MVGVRNSDHLLARQRLSRLETFLSAWNTRDVETLMACMAENCVFYSSAGPDASGKQFIGHEAVRHSYANLFEKFPRAAWTNGRHYVCGDVGLSSWRFIGIDNDGMTIEVDGCDIFSFTGDLISSKDSYRKNRSQ